MDMLYDRDADIELIKTKKVALSATVRKATPMC